MSALGAKPVAVLTALLALVLSACSVSEPPATVVGAEIDADKLYTVSSTPLRDTDGEVQSLDAVEKDLTMVFFGYTHCPDICGIVMSTVAAAVNRLEPEQRDRVDVVLVTTDPARDDEQVLREYLDRFDPSFEGLTGDLDDVVEVGSSVKVAIEEGEKLPSGGYDVAHSDHVTGLDADGNGFIIWSRDVSSADLASDIELILAR